MVAYLSDKVVVKFIQSGSIQEDEKALYIYGLQQGFFIILNVVTIMIIGSANGMFWESILFMVAYLPLRSFAGGFHAKSPMLCYLYSITLISAVLLAIRFIPWTNSICLGLAVIAGVVIFILSPVEDFNKPLDQIETVIYKKWTRIILAVESAIFLLALVSGQTYILSVIAVSLVCLSIMLILGKMRISPNSSGCKPHQGKT